MCHPDLTHTEPAMIRDAFDFSDMENSADLAPWTTGDTALPPAGPADLMARGVAALHAAPVVTPMYRERCAACGGSGVWRGGFSRHGGQCFKCKGKGFKEFKTSAASRAKSKAAGAKKREADRQNIANMYAEFCEANPRIAAWWTNTDFEFAISLREACQKYGMLTERQLAAATRCVESLEAKRAEREQAAASAPTVNVATILASLVRAREAGIRWPKLRMGSEDVALIFSLAGENSRNPGAVYVKRDHDDVYLGKVVGTQFHASRDCTPSQSADVANVMADPAAAAVAYGKRFGVCSCCGRDLTNAESIERGIGPICFEKYFGG